MKLLGPRPHWTLTGVALLIGGLILEWHIWTHLGTNFWLIEFIAPLMVGLGAGFLYGTWHETRKIKRAERAWLASEPEEDDYDSVYEEVVEPAPATGRRRGKRADRRAIRAARDVPPEDSPYWTTYTGLWVDKPKNPTDDKGEDTPQ